MRYLTKGPLKMLCWLWQMKGFSFYGSNTSSSTLQAGIAVRKFELVKREKKMFKVISLITVTVSGKYVDMGARLLGADSKFCIYG